MRVLITGADGQLARALVALAPQTFVTKALARTELNLAGPSTIDRSVGSFRPDLIINAAAYTAVDAAENDVESCFRVNAEGAASLARAARAVDARLVQVSTDFVFSGAHFRPYGPDAATSPLSVYGRSKLQGEQAVLEILGRRALVLRTAWLYSAVGRNFVTTMLRLMRSGKSVRVICDQIGTPTSTESVATTIWQLAQVGTAAGGVFHWTDAGVASWYDFAVAVAEEGSALGLIPANVDVEPISTEEYPTAARRPPFSVLDYGATVAIVQRKPIHWRKNLRAVMGKISHE